jgi:hypothetical protein
MLFLRRRNARKRLGDYPPLPVTLDGDPGVLAAAIRGKIDDERGIVMNLDNVVNHYKW